MTQVVYSQSPAHRTIVPRINAHFPPTSDLIGQQSFPPPIIHIIGSKIGSLRFSGKTNR